MPEKVVLSNFLGKDVQEFIWIEGSGILGCDTVWLGARFLMLWRYSDTLIFQEPLTQPHSLTSQKTWILSNTVVRTLGLKFCELLKESAWETSFSPLSLMWLLHWSVHEQYVFTAVSSFSPWAVCVNSVNQSMKSDVPAVLVSPWTVCFWLQCHHSVHEQSVCVTSVIQSMNNLFVTAVS